MFDARRQETVVCRIEDYTYYPSDMGGWDPLPCEKIERFFEIYKDRPLGNVNFPTTRVYKGGRKDYQYKSWSCLL